MHQGQVRTTATVVNPVVKDGSKIEVDCLVDTGSVMVMLPCDVVEKLEVPITGKANVTLANDQAEEMSIAGPIRLSIGDRTTHLDCLVGPRLAEPLLSQLALESLDLIVDSPRRKLKPRPESPAIPSFKLK